MPIRFFCEKCHKPLEVSSELAGQQALCFHCKSRTNVPETSNPELLQDNVMPIDEAQEKCVAEYRQKDINTRTFLSSGAIGLLLAVAMIVVLLIMLSSILSEIKPVIKSEEFKRMSEQKQAQHIREEIQRITKLPKTVILASSSILLWISAAIFSLIGFVRRKGQIAGIIGLVICSGVLLAIIRQMR